MNFLLNKEPAIANHASLQWVSHYAFSRDNESCVEPGQLTTILEFHVRITDDMYIDRMKMLTVDVSIFILWCSIYCNVSRLISEIELLLQIAC